MCISLIMIAGKGSLHWKNDLCLYYSLVLVMNIGMCGLLRLASTRVLTSCGFTSIRILGDCDSLFYQLLSDFTTDII